jgi:hypothetical protein
MLFTQRTLLLSVGANRMVAVREDVAHTYVTIPSCRPQSGNPMAVFAAAVTGWMSEREALTHHANPAIDASVGVVAVTEVATPTVCGLSTPVTEGAFGGVESEWM